MTEPRTALLTGATGLVGGYLLHRLLDDDVYTSVTALVRRPLEIGHPKLAAPVVDFEHLDGALERLRASDVFCCLGTTLKNAGSRAAFRSVDHGYVVALARLARAGGARRLVMVSAAGADPGSWVFYSRVKGEAERDVAAVGYSELHILRPSVLVGPRQERRPGERLGIALARLIAPVLVGPLASYHAVDADTVAAAMVGAAKSGDEGHHVHTYGDIVRLAAA